MNRKQLLLSILALFLTAYLINNRYLANAMQGSIRDSYEEYFKTYDISFVVKADLNNDGKEEKVTIFRQWDGEDWWSDDMWYVICIFDDKHNVLYKSDVSYFQEVNSFSVKDTDGDGLKEVIVTLDPTKYWDAEKQIYGWKDNNYRLIEQVKS
ncbi:MAG: hypothetical protein KKC39_00990 [Candidatus Omnitrophica bacterium]|nr:hypothetical protein [Candidatus Omnitrophota bacterium]MCG2707433.1 hypothetical protein [Candidatus Omnitrophota bacterium]